MLAHTHTKLIQCITYTIQLISSNTVSGAGSAAAAHGRSKEVMELPVLTAPTVSVAAAEVSGIRLLDEESAVLKRENEVVRKE